MSAWNELRYLAREVPLGTSIGNGICPFCRGGSNGDRAFSVTRDLPNSALYCCHRAKCGESGRVFWGGQGMGTATYEVAPVPDTEVYSSSTRQVGGEWMCLLRDTYGLDQEEVDWAEWREGVDDSLLICPFFGPDGIPRGVEARNLLRLPWELKTRLYRDRAEVRLGWYIRPRGHTQPILPEVVIVEDLISGLKVSRHADVAVLLGSSINVDQLEEILTVNTKGVICLDPDATGRANTILRRYRFLAPNFRTVPLSKDMKYESDERILELLNA